MCLMALEVSYSLHLCRPQTKFAKVIVFTGVCLSTEGGGSLSTWGDLCPQGVSIQGVSVQGGLCRGVGEVSVQGILCQGDPFVQ